MPQFEPQEAVDLVLSQELLLMQMLYYHLTVHNPYRPLEGLLIDIKVSCALDAVYVAPCMWNLLSAVL